MTEMVTIALITAVPATLAATAAWWNAAKINRKLATANGHTMGQLSEASYELTKSISHRQDELSKSLEVHITDNWIHREEQRKEPPCPQ